MKCLLIIVSFLIVFGQSFAQEDHQGLFHASKFESNAFVQFEGYATDFANDIEMSTGFGLYWLVNHQYYLGARYSQITTPAAPIVTIGGGTEAGFKSAGLVVGYILFAEKAIQFSPDLGLAWGNMQYEFPEGMVERSDFFLLSPSLKASYSVHDNFRFGAAFSYRQSIGASLADYDDADVSGWSAGIFFRAGKF